jgi:tetratricopeptide (TPR) repeat protein
MPVVQFKFPVIMLCIALFCGYGSPLSAAQYRSKLLLNSNQSLDEAAQLSIEELEAEFTHIQQDYARSTAGAQLARHFVQQGEWSKAVDYYQAALAAKGLSEVVGATLISELSGVYIKMNQPDDALNTLRKLGGLNQAQDGTIAMLYAQAFFQKNDFVAVAEALEKVMSITPKVDEPLYRQVVALAYQIGDFKQCEMTLTALLNAQDAEPDYWFQLASVLMKQNKSKQALSVLLLAYLKGIPFQEKNVLLLSSLYASEGSPIKAAQLLEDALQKGIVVDNAAYSRRLFEYWLQAQEQDKALLALAHAAQLSGETELYLYWAQLLMQRSAWVEMNRVILDMCKGRLSAQQVGSANLLLGISEYYLGHTNKAEKAFINATLVGGANEKAGKWLQRLYADSGKEAAPHHVGGKLSGPCRAADE